MDTKKTLRYNWEFGHETVAIRVRMETCTKKKEN